jgi:hypothetical protein
MTEPVRLEGFPGRYWHRLEDGRIQCDVCPRYCRLNEGQRGLCFVRGRQDDRIVLTTYGRSSGFCVDPIEKKPLVGDIASRACERPGRRHPPHHFSPARATRSNRISPPFQLKEETANPRFL